MWRFLKISFHLKLNCVVFPIFEFFFTFFFATPFVLLALDPVRKFGIWLEKTYATVGGWFPNFSSFCHKLITILDFSRRHPGFFMKIIFSYSFLINSSCQPNLVKEATRSLPSCQPIRERSRRRRRQLQWAQNKKDTEIQKLFIFVFARTGKLP